MTPTLTFVAGLFVGGILMAMGVALMVAIGRALGNRIGKKVAPLVKVDAKKVDVEKMKGTKKRAPVDEDISTVDSDTAIVRTALKGLKFNKDEIEWAVGQVRGRPLPVPEKIRAALAALGRFKRESNFPT